MNRVPNVLLATIFIAAGVFFVTPSAKAEILSLECRRGSEPSWVDYWVDLQQATLTLANVNAQGVQTGTLMTYRVAITPQSFNFNTGMGPVSINRMTGVNSWPNQDPYMCSKGTLPLPTGKF